MDNLLTSRPIPPLSQKLMAEFTREALEAREVLAFDPDLALAALQNSQTAMAIDIGGNKVAVAEFSTSRGKLERTGEYHSPRTLDGGGYFRVLQTAAKTAVARNLAVGISFAGPIQENEPAAGANVPLLMRELKRAGGFKALFGKKLKAVDNDAVAGLKAAAVQAKRLRPKMKNVIFVIVGSGMGGAVLKDDQILPCEPGHIMVPEELNPFQRNKPCGLFGHTFTCLEEVGGGKAGIEETWQELTGKALSAPEVQDLADAGDDNAIELYDTSAVMAAHVAIGLSKAFDLNANDTVVACHGGIFNHDSYRPRVIQLLQNYGYNPPVIFTRDFSDNACLDGAAIAALTAS